MTDSIYEANETLEQLELLIGKDNARKVFEFFEGSSFYFPKRIGLAEQHRQIFAELRAGATYADLAEKYRYTKSYIRKIEHKLTAERRALLKAGITPPDETASASTDPVKLDVPHSRPFEPGELFYEH
mgnify:FL=1|nr:MAG TPA: Mor transcription activator family [Caudoviricetes sp.]